MTNLTEMTKILREDIKVLLAENNDPKHINDINMIRRIISRSHTFNSLVTQLKCFVKNTTSKKKWLFFPVGHNKLTRQISKVINFHSQEKRIRDLEEKINLLNIEINKIHDLHEQEKAAILSSFRKANCNLQKENAKLVRQVHDLLDISGHKIEPSKKPFIPKLAAIVDNMNGARATEVQLTSLK